MKLLARHSILVSGEHYEDCKAQIYGFFKKTSLVQYDKIAIDSSSAVSGDNECFQEKLENSLEQNRRVLTGLVEELKSAGFEKRSDLPDLQQGYPSKVLHIIAHFLDGFIGIDSVFYNLIDDSHWVFPETRELLAEKPETFWLVPLDCYSMTPREATLLHM
ncbi:MAG: hypothetical protein V2I35_04480 [Desulfocapsaceae bacterium]|jgi:hypothetical protein|nr:hypothetical protein [Desulfocapsaceae bacterium]